MYLGHFGLSAFPFATTPDPRFYYPSAKHKEALACLLYAVEQRKGFALITGEVGAGKTMLCRAALDRLGDTIESVFLVHSSLSPMEFLQAVSAELGIVADGKTKAELLRALRDLLVARREQGRIVVLIVDEAQGLSREVLEEVRLLGNLETASHKLLQIILVGQPELRRLIGTREMHALDQRIPLKFHLGTLSLHDVSAYVDHRLGVAGAETQDIFDSEAKSEVFRATEGIPRLVNIICDQALLQAYVNDERTVGARTVRRVVSEMDGYYMDEPAQEEVTTPDSAAPVVTTRPAPALQRPGCDAWRDSVRSLSIEPKPAGLALPRTPSLRPVRSAVTCRRRTPVKRPFDSFPDPVGRTKSAASDNEQSSDEAAPAEPLTSQLLPDDLQSVDELCEAIQTGKLPPEYRTRTENKDFARFRLDGLEVRCRLTKADSRRYTILTAGIGCSDMPDAMKVIPRWASGTGYLRMTDTAYLRQYGDVSYTLKVGPKTLSIACGAVGNDSDAAVVRRILKVHGQLDKLLKAIAAGRQEETTGTGQLRPAASVSSVPHRTGPGVQMARLSCPQCGATVGVYEDEVGRSGTCPGCATTIQVPWDLFTSPEGDPKEEQISAVEAATTRKLADSAAGRPSQDELAGEARGDYV